MLKKWRKQERGIVAVEFAMIIFPLIILITGIVETSLLFATGIVLEGSSADAARLVRTGQAQDSADPQSVFESRLCYLVRHMIDCNDLQYEVISMGNGDFSDAAAYAPTIDGDGNLVPGAFSGGASEAVVLIRTYYKYEFLTPMIGAIMTGEGQNWVSLMSTAVIKNEPYEFGG